MTTCLALFACAFVLAVGATMGVRWMARRLGVVDRPDQFRKIHRREMPRLGGVAVFVAFVAPLLGLYLLRHGGLAERLHQEPTRLAALLAAAALALLAGVADDAWGLRPRWKLLVQTAAASIAVAAGAAITVVSNPFGEPLQLGAMSFPLSVFWLLCCMNGVNLIDGLDGLAAGVCLVVSVTFFLFGLLLEQPLCMVLSACLCGAILGFLVFNFHPASIFLGDSGSLLLGFLVGVISLLGASQVRGAGTQLVPVIALGLPLFDTALAALRRWSRRLPVSAADRQHIHHGLMAIGLSHRRVVLVLYAVSVALGAAALLVTVEHAEVTVLVLGSLGGVCLVSARLFGGLRLADVWGRLSGDLAQRRRSAEARMAVERSIARLRAASTLDGLWRAISRALAGLDLDAAELRLYCPAGVEPVALTWCPPGGPRQDEAAPEADLWSIRLAVKGAGGVFGELEATKALGRGPLVAETPELLDRIRREAAPRVGTLAMAALSTLGGPEQAIGAFARVAARPDAALPLHPAALSLDAPGEVHAAAG
jgi:UDP-GlcNAc:undecaprenyl-phosphate GlcNAc-1-phosphate transferase